MGNGLLECNACESATKLLYTVWNAFEATTGELSTALTSDNVDCGLDTTLVSIVVAALVSNV